MGDIVVNVYVQIFYRVYFDNIHQELTCYRLVLGLLRFFNTQSNWCIVQANLFYSFDFMSCHLMI